jgi:hypothetical protein
MDRSGSLPLRVGKGESKSESQLMSRCASDEMTDPVVLPCSVCKSETDTSSLLYSEQTHSARSRCFTATAWCWTNPWPITPAAPLCHQYVSRRRDWEGTSRAWRAGNKQGSRQSQQRGIRMEALPRSAHAGSALLGAARLGESRGPMDRAMGQVEKARAREDWGSMAWMCAPLLVWLGGGF